MSITLPVPESADPRVSRRSIARDALRFGSAVVAGAAIGMAQVFVMPRLVSVDTFGFYRIFVVYAGLVGTLHFGIVDGALLRWAGHPMAVVAAGWRRLLRSFFALEMAVAASLCAAAWLLWPRPLALVLVGVAGAAIAVNTLTLANAAFQSARSFGWAGFGVLVPSLVLFAGLLLLPPADRNATTIVALYVGAQLLVAIAASAKLATIRVGAALPFRTRQFVRDGMPIMLANLAAGVAQSGDRLALGAVASLKTNAVYGFAASALFAATVAASALSQVIFPHAAALDGPRRARVLGRAQDAIVVGYAACLAVLPAFELVVERFLPAYTSALPVLRAFAFGAVFWVASQVVLGIRFRLTGLLHQQLIVAIVGAVLTTGGAAWVYALHAPLWAVAFATSVSALVAWAVGTLVLQRRAGDGVGGSIAFAVRCLLATVALVGSTLVVRRPDLATLLYVALAVPTVLAPARRLLGTRDIVARGELREETC